ncbi:MAG: hypothetical protein ABR985_16815 [Methanotrichaceae archaeon]|jgi:hypothetical protein
MQLPEQESPDLSNEAGRLASFAILQLILNAPNCSSAVSRLSAISSVRAAGSGRLSESLKVQYF